MFHLVIDTLWNEKLYINVKNCSFALLSSLGFIVYAQGILTDPDDMIKVI